MKNKKRILVKLFACTLLVGTTAFAMPAFSKQNTLDFDVVTIETATSDGSEIKNEDLTLESFADEDIPLATIGGTSTTSIKNLTSSQLNKIRTNLQNSVNKERKARKATKTKTVTKYTKLQTTGNIRSKEILKKWSHTRPNGKSWSTVLTSNGISKKNLKAGEDLAKITFTARSSYSTSYINQISNVVHQSLMNSPTHKKVILNANYKKIGIGVYSAVKGNKVTVYITEHFKN